MIPLIKRLAEQGIIVEASAARLLEGADAEKVMGKINRMEPKPLVIDEKLARELLREEIVPRLIRKVEPMASMSIPDFVAAYNERYAALQKILLKNPKLTGAVSMGGAEGNCAVIGLIKKAERTEIEDPSGSLVLVSKTKLLDGDVVGVLGSVGGKELHAREVIFPGAQLKGAKICEGSIAIGPGCPTDINADAWYDAGGCVMVTSTANLSELSKELGTDEKEAAIELLRRRHLMAPPQDFLEPQPDILIFKSSKNFAEKYKGVLVVGIKEGTRAEIDLKAREAELSG